MARRRELLLVLGFSGLNAIGGLAANRALTEVVTPRSLGELYLFTNLGLWLALPTASVFIYVQRHWPIARERFATRRFASTLFRGLWCQAALAAVGALALWASGVPGVTGKAALALALYCAGQATAQALGSIPGLERRRMGVSEINFENHSEDTTHSQNRRRYHFCFHPNNCFALMTSTIGGGTSFSQEASCVLILFSTSPE